jgi:hypothetical protein
MGHLPSTDDVELKGDYDPVPKGTYEVEIESSEVVETKNEDPMLKLTLAVVKGDFLGRKIFDQFMLDHATSDKAREIGLRKLKQIKVAIGRPRAEKEEDLWGEPLLAVVKVKTDPEYGDKNEVVKYLPLSGKFEDEPSKPATKAAPAAGAGETAPSEGGAKKKSWRS